MEGLEQGRRINNGTKSRSVRQSRFGHEDVISDLTSEGVIGTKAKLQWVKKGL